MVAARITRERPELDWIACGWFTEDKTYRPLAEKLAESLDAFGTPYDFVAVDRQAGGWEEHTMLKARQFLDAIDRHPGKTVLLMDVDFIAKGDIAPLAVIPGDIAMRFTARRMPSSFVKLGVNSMLMVAKPTEPARRFVETWVDFSKRTNYGDVDQVTLALALANVKNCNFNFLDDAQVWSALAHSGAGRRNIKGWWRETVNLANFVMRRSAPSRG